MIELKVNVNNLTAEERAELIRIVTKANILKSKVWKPEKDEGYFILGEYGQIMSRFYICDEPLEKVFAIGNCFKTNKEADNAVEKLKIRAKLQRYANEHNEEEIDWRDETKSKYYFLYDHCDSMIRIWSTKGCCEPFQIYFTSKEVAEDAIKAVGEERIKKYLFGVE